MSKWGNVAAIVALVVALLALAGVVGLVMYDPFLAGGAGVPVHLDPIDPLAAVERIGIWSREDSKFYNGADVYVYSDEFTTQKLHIDGATGNLDGEGTLDVAGNTALAGTLGVTGASSFTGAMTGPATGTENLRLPTIESSAVTTTSDGAMWTVGASEIWWIDRVFCNVTTNFDCTGDDCTIEIGLTGGDIDGILDLDDAELQAADAEISGLTAGWQGFGSTDTRGAFCAAGGGVILGNDTIDIKIEDNSDQSNPTAGAATCYIVYTRLQ